VSTGEGGGGGGNIYLNRNVTIGRLKVVMIEGGITCSVSGA